MSDKLQKVLAQQGLGSRRELEAWISAGRVKVDGKVAILGDRVTEQAHIMVDDHPIPLQSSPPLWLCYHKPVDQICTRSDPQGRPTVFSALPTLTRQRWIMVGRLDINTSGLLLFTTCGALAHKWMHPRAGIEREYAVRVYGDVTASQCAALTQGVVLDDGMARFSRLTSAGGNGRNRWFHVVITEGRQREVRRLWASQGLQVSRLIRIRFGAIILPKDLLPGQYRYLSNDQNRLP